MQVKLWGRVGWLREHGWCAGMAGLRATMRALTPATPQQCAQVQARGRRQ